MVAREHLNRYSSSLDCALQLLRAEGPRGLFIGGWGAAVKHTVAQLCTEMAQGRMR